MARDPIYDAMKTHFKGKFDTDRARFLSEAQAADDGGWTKHTDYHWSRMLAGHRMDYWPSRKKYQYRGKVRRGDVAALLRSMEGQTEGEGGD